MKKNYKTDPQLLTTFAGIYFLLYIFQFNDNSSFLSSSNFPNFMLIASVFTGMYFGDKIGAIFGFFIGAFVDAISYDVICFNTIFMMLCGYIGGLLIITLLNNNFRTSLILIITASLIYYLCKFALNGFNFEIFRYSYTKSIFLTVIFSIPFYLGMNLIIKKRKKKLSE